MSNRALLPAIVKHRIPVTIFLCAGVVGTSRHFWFSHEAPVRHDSKWKKLSYAKRLASLRRDGFVFETEYGDRQALSKAEIEEMRPFVDFESHSMFHENLLTCGEDDLRRAIFGSKEKLEKDFGLAVSAFAYPTGERERRHVEMIKQAGYRCAVDHGSGIQYRPFRSVPPEADRGPGRRDGGHSRRDHRPGERGPHPPEDLPAAFPAQKRLTLYISRARA